MAVANRKSNNVKSKDVMEKTIENDIDLRETRNKRLVELKERLTLNGGLESNDSSVDNDSQSMPPPPPPPIVHVAPPGEITDASASLTDFNAHLQSNTAADVTESVDMERPFHNIGGKRNNDKSREDDEGVKVTGINGIVNEVTPKLDQTMDSKLDTNSNSKMEILVNSDSQTSLSNITENGITDNSKPSKKKRHNVRDPIALEAKENGLTTPKKMKTKMLMVSAETLVEYKWPRDDNNSETYMIQEQVSLYLDILSFKRKYPDLERRTVEKDERTYLLETFPLFTCSHFDYGITALRSDQLHELMSKDYPKKFKDFATILRKREQKKMNDTTKGIGLLKNDKKKLQEYTESATKSASEFNTYLMRERREERMAYFDLQTSEVHYPFNKWRKLTRDATFVGKYPVSLIPGQFQDNFKRYTPEELFHLPLSSARLRPPVPQTIIIPYVPEPVTKQPLKPQSKVTSENEISSTTDSDLPLKPSPLPVRNKVLTSRSRRSAASDRTPRRKIRSDKGISRVRSANSLTDQTQFSFPGIPCNVCILTAESKQEDLVKCSECERLAHPTCLELTPEMVPMISTYNWQCMECKICFKCEAPHDEDKMMFCDHCDRGYHTYCVNVKSIPIGRWQCPSCSPQRQPNTPDTRRNRQR